MSTRILVDATKPLGKLICEAADELRIAVDKLNRVKDACDAMTYGETAPFPSLQTELGVSATTSGNTAADYYTLLQNVMANTALGAAIIDEYIRRTDQG